MSYDDGEEVGPYLFAVKDIILYFDHYLLDKFSPGMRDIFLCIQPVLELLQSVQMTAKAVIAVGLACNGDRLRLSFLQCLYFFTGICHSIL